ncbi:hypothetical protein [Burkholderia ambifaria]
MQRGKRAVAMPDRARQSPVFPRTALCTRSFMKSAGGSRGSASSKSIGVTCPRQRPVAIDGLAVRDQAARPSWLPNYGIVAGCVVRGARCIPIRSHLSTCMEHS